MSPHVEVCAEVGCYGWDACVWGWMEIWGGYRSWHARRTGLSLAAWGATALSDFVCGCDFGTW